MSALAIHPFTFFGRFMNILRIHSLNIFIFPDILTPSIIDYILDIEKIKRVVPRVRKSPSKYFLSSMRIFNLAEPLKFLTFLFVFRAIFKNF